MPDTQPSDDRPMLFETGRDDSLAAFIQANDDALTVCAVTQAAARAQIKKFEPLSKSDREKNAELQTIIDEAAPGRADSVRDALQRGARLAFLAGRPEKVQAMLADPARFICVKKDLPHGEATYKAENIILLMYASKTPADVPALALAKAAEGDKQATLEYTLFRLVSAHNKIEPLAFDLLQAGAKADGVILAEAVRKNVSLALIERLVQKGADYNAAFDIMNSNPGYFGDSAQRLAAMRAALANQSTGTNQPTGLKKIRPTPFPRFRL
jgi:hypothetical protein